MSFVKCPRGRCFDNLRNLSSAYNSVPAPMLFTLFTLFTLLTLSYEALSGDPVFKCILKNGPNNSIIITRRFFCHSLFYRHQKLLLTEQGVSMFRLTLLEGGTWIRRKVTVYKQLRIQVIVKCHVQSKHCFNSGTVSLIDKLLDVQKVCTIWMRI